MSGEATSLGPLPGGAPIGEPLWGRLNRSVIARAVTELAYEEGLSPQPRDAAERSWELKLDGGASYRFAAVRRIWGQLSIVPESLVRIAEGRSAPAHDAVQFMIDARETLDIAPDTLCIYARELVSTLLADARIAARNRDIGNAALIGKPDSLIQQFLIGHPKAPANKGRIGWGLADAEAFAPEFGATTRLFWIAAARSACRLALAGDVSEEALLAAAVHGPERKRLDAVCRARGVSPEGHVLIPVHPWQWDTMIVAQFAGEIAAGRIVPLGLFGDAHQPQQSLRTLANADRPESFHVKLPLTVLNTSAWRGVPGRYMAAGALFSDWLAERAAQDPVLASALILREVAGVFYPHPLYGQIADAPYQFNEMLGAIWRESPEACLGPGRTALMMGALTHRDCDGEPLICALIARSGLSAQAWLARLFDAVVVPLYHYLCRYGVGFLAHGQNVTLVLEGCVVVGVALKDLQGDVDLVEADFPEQASLPAEVAAAIARKPAAHLIHHLQTGHFASVLRFISDALAEHDGFDEIAFYRILGERIRRYQAAQPDLAERFRLFDLFQPEMARVCINRVRLAVGYSDANRRPVPSLGSPLRNPLHLAESAGVAAARPTLETAGEFA